MPNEWVERLFDRFAAMYGNRFATMWAGSDLGLVKQEWAEGLADLTRAELHAGVAAARLREWPPTLGEFIALCRPEPDYAEMFVRAQLGERSDPVTYWAAVQFGHLEIRVARWPQARARWVECVDRARRSTLAEVPVQDRKALPAPGATRTSEVARKAIDGIKAMLGVA